MFSRHSLTRCVCACGWNYPRGVHNKMSNCALPDNFVVTEKEKYGRGVSTMTSIRAGTKVRTDEPYAYVLNESSRGVLCDCCFEAG